MSFMEKLKNIMGVPEDEQYEDDYDDDDVEIIAKKVKTPAQAASELSKRNKVVNIHTTAQLQVVLVKPERFEDASSIADHLNEKRTLVLNLESTNKDVSRRLVDFLSGVAYANNGQIKRVANSTFIITHTMLMLWETFWMSLKTTAYSFSNFTGGKK